MTLFEDETRPAAVGTPVERGVVQHGGGRGGVGTHQSAAMKNDEWLTPPHVLRALGPFDLDPCAPG